MSRNSQTLLEQRNRLSVLLFQIPIPDPVHPRVRLLCDLLQITPHPLRHHAEQFPRLP